MNTLSGGFAAGDCYEPETADEISIGRMYEYGEGVPQDYATALHWYQLAAASRDTAAEAGVQRVEQLVSR
jgi:hypothetical protein